MNVDVANSQRNSQWVELGSTRIRFRRKYDLSFTHYEENLLFVLKLCTRHHSKSIGHHGNYHGCGYCFEACTLYYALLSHGCSFKKLVFFLFQTKILQKVLMCAQIKKIIERKYIFLGKLEVLTTNLLIILNL